MTSVEVTPESESPPIRKRLTYSDKLIMAPMVRIGTLPMRLLALEYGADIVYTEELVDWKLLRSVRRVNDVLGTVDYIDRTDGTVVFRTCARERDRVVLQLGTCDAQRASKVARLVERDVAGIDLNMGCPRRFSILGGMGAALLKQPEKAREILAAMVGATTLPVTCKIRVLPEVEDTLRLCDVLAGTGIAAIAVHGRTASERPKDPNRTETIRRIAEHLEIPVIANGGSKDIEKRQDMFRFKLETGCSSVMIARSAEWNCSIFRAEGMLPMDEVIREYLRLAVDYDNSPSNTKYCLQNILREMQETPLGKKFLQTQTLEQICELWDMGDYCRAKSREYRAKGFEGRFEVAPERLLGLRAQDGTADDDDDNHHNRNPDHQQRGEKRKLEDEATAKVCDLKNNGEADDDVLRLHCAFLRSNFPEDLSLPKSRLIRWAESKRLKLPKYVTQNEDKLFRAVVLVDGRKYGSSFWEKSKKWAEQGAALACLCFLGEIDADTLRKNGHLLA